MIVRNPTNQEIQVIISGRTYILPANGQILTSDEHAHYWKGKLHSFIVLEPEPITETLPVSPTITEDKTEDLVVETKTETPIEEVSPSLPAAVIKAASKTKKKK